MTPEDKLSALFGAEAPPPRDLAFEARVAERIAVRRLWATILSMIPFAIAAATVLWGLRPVWSALGDSAVLTPFADAGLTSGLTLAIGGALLLFALRVWDGARRSRSRLSAG